MSIALPLILLLVIPFVLPLLSHPLRKLPAAHPIAHVSRLWVLWKTLFKQRNRGIHSAHQKHGPIVRLGPNEVSVCSLEALKLVYSGSGFEKSSWYRVFENYGLPPMFTLRTTSEHSARKRMIANIYSKSFVTSSPLISGFAESILSHLRHILEQSPEQEVHNLFSAMAMDFITAFLFTPKYGTRFIEETLKGDLTMRQRFLTFLYQPKRKYFPYASEIPDIVAVVRKLSFGRLRIVPEWVGERSNEIERWCLGMCHAWEAYGQQKPIMADVKREWEDDCVYSRLCSTSNLPEMIRASEVLDHITAGHETVGVALTYTTHQLSLHPDLQSVLRAEFLPLKATGPPDPKILDKLPNLDAVIMETLRLYSPIPGSQPRVVPKGGCTLHGYFLPEGTVISSQALSLHQNKEIFPEPEKWKPERWLRANEGQRREMERWWWAFGSGARGCVGRNFAMYEMQLALCMIYSNFETEIVNDSGIEMDDRYTSGPVGNQLTLRFKKL